MHFRRKSKRQFDRDLARAEKRSEENIAGSGRTRSQGIPYEKPRFDTMSDSHSPFIHNGVASPDMCVCAGSSNTSSFIAPESPPSSQLCSAIEMEQRNGSHYSESLTRKTTQSLLSDDGLEIQEISNQRKSIEIPAVSFDSESAHVPESCNSQPTTSKAKGKSRGKLKMAAKVSDSDSETDMDPSPDERRAQLAQETLDFEESVFGKNPATLERYRKWCRQRESQSKPDNPKPKDPKPKTLKSKSSSRKKSKP